ncbi:MAG: hypothetical protein HKO54_06905 [Flavobacteriaceae bacterium]|nr:hypothetical protein [Flavobacteriaceae bacterium]
MKKMLFVWLVCTSMGVSSQVLTNDQWLENVSTIDRTLETLYDVISGEKGEKRNWELFKYLFKPEARLIPSGKNKEGDIGLSYLTIDDYIKASGEWLEQNGFFEVEIHRSTQSFGNITQVFSTYESYYSQNDVKPFMRGINSIQLLNDGKRWWVVNIYWANETEGTPIPDQYLPKN